MQLTVVKKKKAVIRSPLLFLLNDVPTPCAYRAIVFIGSPGAS